MSVVNLPLKELYLNLLGEALTDPRNMLSLRICSLIWGLVKEKSQSIAKTFKSSRRSRSINFFECELDPLKILLDNRDRVFELCEEEAKK